MKFVLTVVALVSLAGSAMAKQPYSGLQSRTIKTLSAEQIADLSAGRGMGLALAAELNGYPGPIHAIELADQLHLTTDQVGKLRTLFEAMKAETIPLGAILIRQERSLNDDFARRTVTLASLKRRSSGLVRPKLRCAQRI